MWPTSRETTHLTSVVLPVPAGRPFWRAVRLLALLLTVVLVVALAVTPRPALHVLWDMVIPLLPAVFLVNPLIWRNVCPLATLNDATGSRPGRPQMTPAMTRTGWIVGIALLFVLVPARRFLFNESGVALGVTILLVAALALIGGLLFARRGAFCGSICPVLPVEKLYGQRPLLTMQGARCDTCSLCTAVGCIDLAATKTVAQTIGPPRRDGRWLRTGFGAFAASFPGFVIGYFTAANGDLSTAPAVYLRVLGLAAVSYAIVAAVFTTLRVRAAVAMPLLGAAAFGLYYWFASPNLVAAYGAPSDATMVVRIAVGATLIVWCRTALLDLRHSTDALTARRK